LPREQRTRTLLTDRNATRHNSATTYLPLGNGDKKVLKRGTQRKDPERSFKTLEGGGNQCDHARKKCRAPPGEDSHAGCGGKGEPYKTPPKLPM